MTKQELAEKLRQRQIKKGLVPIENISEATDDEIIDAYITCSHCGEKQLTSAQLIYAINKATDDENFFAICDQINPKHCLS